MNSSPRIVIFAPHFSEYATRMAIGLSRRAAVALLVDKHNFADECSDQLRSEAAKSVDIQTFDVWTRSQRYRSRLRILFKILSFRPTYIHVHEQPDSFTTSVIWLLRRQRMILTVHDPLPHTGNDSVYAAANAEGTRFLRARASMFHTHGEYCKQTLLSEQLNRHVISTAHGAVLAPSPDQELPFEKGRILLFGRMQEYKGIEILLQAAEILRAKSTFFRIVLAGRGPELERLRPQIEGRDDIEVISKYLAPAEAVQQLQRSQLVVAPYLDATQSGVVSAAFANGRPVVASRVGGLIDSVIDGENGVLVEEKNPLSLASALQRVLEDETFYRRLMHGANRTVTREMDWSNISDALLRGYAKLP